MAKIHQKKNSLEVKIKETNTHEGKFLLFFFISIILSPPLAIVGTIIYAIFISGKIREKKIYKCGLTGEIYAINALSKLDDSYHIFSDLLIPFDGKTSQIDIIVVGDNGMFIVEVKNIKGKVKGSIEDKNLTIKKNGRKGGVYYKEMYNPYKQIKTHIYRLSNMLRENNINTWVDGAVLFKPVDSILGERKVLEVIGSENILFDNIEELLNKINSSEKQINKNKKEEIINILNKYV